MASTDRELVIKSFRKGDVYKGVTLEKDFPNILSFPDLFTPKVYENKDGAGNVTYSYSYEANLILDPDHPQIEEVKQAIRDAIGEKWPSNPPTIPVDRRPLRSGMQEDPDTGVQSARWDGYDKKLFISASRKVKSPSDPNPLQLIDGVRGPDKKFVRLTEADGKLYAGAKVNSIIRIYAYDGAKHGNPHRINASLEAVQFAGHGEAFGAKPVDVEDKFDEVGGLMEDGFNDGAASGGTEQQSKPPADDLL